MPTPVWVALVGFGPLALVFTALGLFFRLRPRFNPFVKSDGIVGPSSDPDRGSVVHFVDQAGRDREGLLIAWRLPEQGARVPILYDSRHPELVSRDGPVTDGTALFVVAAATVLSGLVIAVLAVLTGSG